MIDVNLSSLKLQLGRLYYNLQLRTYAVFKI
jgi:hypothetical protein